MKTRNLFAPACLLVVGCGMMSDSEAPAEAMLEIVVDDGAITWNQRGLERIVNGQDDVPARITVKRADGTVLSDIRAGSFREAQELAMVQARQLGGNLPPMLEGFDSWPAAQQEATLGNLQARIEAMRKQIEEIKVERGEPK